MEWQPGYKLKSRPYQIQSVLGEGGFGITYKAQNLVLDIPVVIKTPNRKLQRDKNYRKYVKNFVREAKQLAKLGLNPHHHIVRVIELFTEETLPCIVMDYIPGKSLYDLVQIQGALPETLAVEYIKQIGSALIICHESGIIHRDLHPNNILIHQENQKAVLIDFGISINIQTSRNTYSGNQVFAPWEQLVNFEAQQNKTHQVDIYTIAASLYYLVTGETPTPSLARKYSNRELIPPKQLIPKLSEAINQAIIKGMELDPSNRPNSMKEWLDLLTLPNNQDSSLPHPHSRQIPLTFATDKITINDRGEEIKRKKIQSEYFTEDLGNGVTLDMVYIPGGSFLMGSPEGEGSHAEKPQHEVKVQSFFIGKYPVTQEQWRAVASLPKVKQEIKSQPSHFKGDRRPVEQVSWDDAVEFCQRLSKYTGKEYRLPSEAEWEYACRAGTTTPFYFGETISGEVVNCKRNLGMALIEMFLGETTEVGSFLPNAFDLYDLHGNVWEWCEDNWHDNYQNAPTNGSAWISGYSIIKVVRGGSWFNHPSFCRSAYRAISFRGFLFYSFGFRVVCVVPRQT